ncbi:MAG: hypothetical protein AAF682_19480 [Planctomycetota bacterium]
MRDELLDGCFEVLRRIVGLARPFRRVLEQMHPGLYEEALALVDRLADERTRAALVGTEKQTKVCATCSQEWVALDPEAEECPSCVHAAAAQKVGPGEPQPCISCGEPTMAARGRCLVCHAEASTGLRRRAPSGRRRAASGDGSREVAS